MGYPFSLDFSVESSTDRLEEVKKITNKFPSLSESALEILANYILYGKDPDGKSAVQKKEVKILSRYNPVPKNSPVSLDELTEKSLTGEVRHLQTLTKFKTPKVLFPRKDYEDHPLFKDLLSSIDETKFIVGVNDGKIKAEKEILNEETGEITIEVDNDLKDRIAATPILNQYSLYLLRHTLIEKQKEQYLLKDYVSPPILSHGNTRIPYRQDIDWGNGRYEVGPVGLYDSRSFLFKPFTVTRRTPYPDLPPLPSTNATFFLDFRDPKHVYKIIKLYKEFEKQAEIEGDTSFSRLLLQTFFFYYKKAALSKTQIDILKLKISRVSNLRIASIINKKYETNYTKNYISTIFTQQVVTRIAEAATLHEDEIFALNEPDKWMRCRRCGQYKLLNESQFCYRTKSSNGFSSRCKVCDRDDREERKEKEIEEKRINEEKSRLDPRIRRPNR